MWKISSGSADTFGLCERLKMTTDTQTEITRDCLKILQHLFFSSKSNKNMSTSHRLTPWVRIWLCFLHAIYHSGKIEIWLESRFMVYSENPGTPLNGPSWWRICKGYSSTLAHFIVFYQHLCIHKWDWLTIVQDTHKNHSAKFLGCNMSFRLDSVKIAQLVTIL